MNQRGRALPAAGANPRGVAVRFGEHRARSILSSGAALDEKHRGAALCFLVRLRQDAAALLGCGLLGFGGLRPRRGEQRLALALDPVEVGK